MVYPRSGSTDDPPGLDDRASDEPEVPLCESLVEEVTDELRRGAAESDDGDPPPSDLEEVWDGSPRDPDEPEPEPEPEGRDPPPFADVVSDWLCPPDELEGRDDVDELEDRGAPSCVLAGTVPDEPEDFDDAEDGDAEDFGDAEDRDVKGLDEPEGLAGSSGG